MATTYNVYDCESGAILSVFANVAAARLTAAVLTSGQAEVVVASTTNLWPGMVLAGKGVPANTVVLSVDSDTTFTMSANASATVAAGVIVARGYISDPVVRELQLEHYRDLFIGSTTFDALHAPSANPRTITMPGAGIYVTDPEVSYHGDGTTDTTVITGTMNDTQSDDVSHTPPREQVQKVSTCYFICTDGAILPFSVFPNMHIAQAAAA